MDMKELLCSLHCSDRRKNLQSKSRTRESRGLFERGGCVGEWSDLGVGLRWIPHHEVEEKSDHDDDLRSDPRKRDVLVDPLPVGSWHVLPGGSDAEHHHHSPQDVDKEDDDDAAAAHEAEAFLSFVGLRVVLDQGVDNADEGHKGPEKDR